MNCAEPCCSASEHVFHMAEAFHTDPEPGELCCCGAMPYPPLKDVAQLSDNPASPDYQELQDTSTPPRPGHCGRCGRPLDSPGHVYKDGAWVCLR